MMVGPKLNGILFKLLPINLTLIGQSLRINQIAEFKHRAHLRW